MGRRLLNKIDLNPHHLEQYDLQEGQKDTARKLGAEEAFLSTQIGQVLFVNALGVLFSVPVHFQIENVEVSGAQRTVNMLASLDQPKDSPVFMQQWNALESVSGWNVVNKTTFSLNITTVNAGLASWTFSEWCKTHAVLVVFIVLLPFLCCALCVCYRVRKHRIPAPVPTKHTILPPKNRARGAGNASLSTSTTSHNRHLDKIEEGEHGDNEGCSCQTCKLRRERTLKRERTPGKEQVANVLASVPPEIQARLSVGNGKSWSAPSIGRKPSREVTPEAPRDIDEYPDREASRSGRPRTATMDLEIDDEVMPPPSTPPPLDDEYAYEVEGASPGFHTYYTRGGYEHFDDEEELFRRSP